MTTPEKIGKFIAESEERTYQEFMDIAGLGKEYKEAKFIPQIKDVLEEFAERGYRIENKEIPNSLDSQILVWRISLFLDDNEIISQDIRVILRTTQETIMENNTQKDIIFLFDNFKAFLLEKNKRYGDSALNPIQVFSNESAEDQIRARLNDKLKRIKNSDELRKNDVADLFGYTALLMISRGWLEFSDLLD